ncbi:two-component system OmpR family response regulator [Frischella perrara]|jgi:Response regulators consisting of a CheY-like receiver domain and a winged-helix DNA-binding domain|uniref:Response regulator with CheY-like receiver and winged-helix DNA-binding domains n=1 Tax=Frischella perrara TaxID=1267021 RepID=A0A0A7S539_FRIPE|nr:response regulator transcription factor [Frischella perrara]AJA45932.1 Response regulator with CheY-like receiver and winged-helix DNA-binding domains [Frischella perrara]MCT6876335.1 response regulator transcription factor [Frischella perrara]PWV62533.1 two-component system OmpR family response regulator [Frischella perrara]
MINILLIDDDVELSQMLSEYLTNESFKVKVVHQGQEGINEALTGEYKAIILDIMLPDLNGIDVLKNIRQSLNTPVIMLTAKGDNIDRVLGLELGADDYIPKPCYPRELLARLRAVLRRMDDKQPYAELDDKKYQFHDLTLDIPQRLCMWKNITIELTSTEFNLLALLVKNNDRVVTKEELSEEGLGRARELYDRSVDVHISNIRQKLHQLTRDAITIETIRAVGYRIR